MMGFEEEILEEEIDPDYEPS